MCFAVIINAPKLQEPQAKKLCLHLSRVALQTLAWHWLSLFILLNVRRACAVCVFRLSVSLQSVSARKIESSLVSLHTKLVTCFFDVFLPHAVLLEFFHSLE